MKKCSLYRNFLIYLSGFIILLLTLIEVCLYTKIYRFNDRIKDYWGIKEVNELNVYLYKIYLIFSFYNDIWFD